MSDFSDYMENLIIDHLLRKQSYTPVNTYVALFTANTGLESNAPTSEVSGSNYARLRVDDDLSEAASGESDNDSDLTFNEATGDWGTITDVAIVDDASNTNWGNTVNVLMWSALNANKAVGNGDTFKISAGDLDVAIT